MAALAPSACTPSRRRGPSSTATPGPVLNDVHSKLNATRVIRVNAVRSLNALREAVRAAAADGQAISIAGGRHAMGGQQFGTGTVNIDTSRLDRVIAFDRERGLLEAEAGIQWPELIDYYLRAQEGGGPGWGIAQKQTGTDSLSLGGSLAANGHGRGLTMKPLVGDVESFTLVDADGGLRRCSRTHEAELFSLAIGGYGLFGPIYSIRLRLVPRRKTQRLVEIRSAKGLADAFRSRIAEGFTYGDFQFSVDPASGGFLQEGVFSCYRPVAADVPVSNARRELSEAQWTELIYLAHENESEAFRRYSRYYASTSGQIYWADTQQLGYYAEDYHVALDRRLRSKSPGSEMITELYVPLPEITGFLQDAADWLRETHAEVVYGTVRLIERDDETFLPWAKDRFACTVINLHVDHSPAGIERAKREFRGLIDLARKRGGSFFLTYHSWATREQIEDCYPEMPEFLRRKLEFDPRQRFQSDWYRRLRRLFPEVSGDA